MNSDLNQGGAVQPIPTIDPNKGSSTPDELSKKPNQGLIENARDSLTWKILCAIYDFVKTPQGAMLTVVGFGILFAFQYLILSLREWWFVSDQYYTHGPIIPFLTAYIIWDRREAIQKAAGIVSTFDKVVAWVAFALIIPWLFLAIIASRTDMLTVLSVGIIITMLLTTVFIWGYKKAWYISPGILYLFLGFPIGRGFLDKLTNPLQSLSTTAAFHFLKLGGLQPMQINANQLVIGNYSLYVAAACAGLGMSLSVFAFVVLFLLIGRLKWWANCIMLVIWLPLVIFINGIRIAMIGVVGNYQGDAAAASFHDWSGYISLAIMFVILMRLTRALGWK